METTANTSGGMNWPADNGGHTKNHWYKQAWPKPTATDRGEYKHANLKHSEHDAEICKATYVLTGNDSG
jgi:hypothetical protein